MEGIFSICVNLGGCKKALFSYTLHSYPYLSHIHMYNNYNIDRVILLLLQFVLKLIVLCPMCFRDFWELIERNMRYCLHTYNMHTYVFFVHCKKKSVVHSMMIRDNKKFYSEWICIEKVQSAVNNMRNEGQTEYTPILLSICKDDLLDILWDCKVILMPNMLCYYLLEAVIVVYLAIKYRMSME